MEAKSSVSKELYRRLAEVKDWKPSGEIEMWDVLGATGSTITRKLRLLQENKYIEVKYTDGYAWYRALITQAERDAYVPRLEGAEGIAQIQEHKTYTIMIPIRPGVRHAVRVSGEEELRTVLNANPGSEKI